MWHNVALRLLYRNVVLFIGNARSVTLTGFADLPTRSHLPARLVCSSVQTVTLSVVSWPSIFEVTTHHVLSALIDAGLSFPSARRVCVKLRQPPFSRKPLHIDNTTGNDLAFSRIVKRLAPAFSALSLDFGGNKLNTHLTLLYRTLLTELLLGTDKYALSDTYYLAYPSVLPLPLTNLVRLSFRRTALSLLQEALIRENAPSLKSLVVTMASVDIHCWMFDSSARSLAVYSVLEYLRVSFPASVDRYTWPDISDVVPFPNLETLHMYGYYPFKDDAIFRGNKSSLSRVSIPFNMLVRGIISANDIFSSGHPNRLRSITIGALTHKDMVDVGVCGTSHINQQIAQIAASTSRLVYRPGYTTRKDVILTFKIQHGLRSLEHLELSNRSLTLRDVVDLVSCVPGLSSLSCRLGKALSSIDSVNIDKWLDRLYSRMYPLSQQFKSWTTQPGSGMTVRHFAHSVMLITVLCPKFYFLSVDRDIRAAFNREVAWAMCTAPFAKHAARLRNIVLGVGIADEEESDAGMDSGPEMSWNIR
ncbi:hypothetical protein GGI09_001417 [Coemansia sp. S100]|nr:hypothetical protein LPJ71_000356 [Coemansia sp. S17]KAJ2102065.1 hypothetical protein GGI09_001417 [Coemansia sp. S100]